MFTGIVEELGEVTEVDDLGDAARLVVRGPTVVSDARPGDSIAVNGVCLTVVQTGDGTFGVDVMKETLDRSSLAGVRPGERVNLERAATLTTRLGGHLVQGHVDATAEVLERTTAERWELLRIALPASLARYVVEKGSVTVDGTSLTVAAVTDADFTVSLVPATLERTTLGSRAVGEHVNLEVDVMAKHVEKLLAAGAASPGRGGEDDAS